MKKRILSPRLQELANTMPRDEFIRLCYKPSFGGAIARRYNISRERVRQIKNKPYKTQQNQNPSGLWATVMFYLKGAGEFFADLCRECLK